MCRDLGIPEVMFQLVYSAKIDIGCNACTVKMGIILHGDDVQGFWNF